MAKRPNGSIVAGIIKMTVTTVVPNGDYSSARAPLNPQPNYPNGDYSSARQGHIRHPTVTTVGTLILYQGVRAVVAELKKADTGRQVVIAALSTADGGSEA